MTHVDELYVLARRVLLDALEALAPHRDAIVLVGAQAVYLRVGGGDLAVAPYTTDADLAVDPAALGEIPPLEQALMDAGFRPETQTSVGVWIVQHPTRASTPTQVAVDLLVPASVSPGKGRRAAKLPGHHTHAARIVTGLEGAIVDVDVMRVGALAADDARVVDVRVAGPAALLVAKVHKIQERLGTTRLSDKDALDVLRLLRGTETSELAARYRALIADSRSARIARAGRDLLEQQFGSRRGAGSTMAVRAAGVLEDGEVVAASCEALARDLLEELKR